ncbi:hypothetical protein [Nocardia sp. NPDC005366]|uniref:hypothetical protein n=1 Tax=Nocardia sp. NPDC005366 TaxID=3156878 RepID=UPI0033AAC6E5
MSTNEPFCDPAGLLDELDAITAAQELLRQRTIALQARYAALQTHADVGRFDSLGENGWSVEEHGSVNVEYTVKYLKWAAQDAGRVGDSLHSARELAVQVREYPQPRRGRAEITRVDRGRSR